MNCHYNIISFTNQIKNKKFKRNLKKIYDVKIEIKFIINLEYFFKILIII